MGDNKKIIKSISYDEDEIIESILQLHCQYPIELDPTYSKGNFYKGKIPAPLHKFDISPQIKEVKQANAEKLPLEDLSINTIMFDPPFLATTGKSLKSNDNNNKINKRFGVYPSEKELHQFYVNSLREFYRILKLNFYF